jgi:hypothetical protein
MDRRFAKYLSRVDLVKNQVERERLKEQESAAAKRRRIQQQNKQRFEHQQQLLRAELAARMAASVASGGDSASSVDADAQAFITAASITDTTQQSAINQLVVDLKGYGIWTKMKALYPFVGGTNAQHAWNLKNTAQYKITWYGGVTSSSNGIIGNGTNGYGDTFLNNNVLAQNDNHLSVYVRTSGGNIGNDLGSWNGSTFGISMYTNFLGGFTAENNSGGTFFTFTQATQGGLYINRRISSTQFVQQRNLLKQTNNNNSSNHIATSFKLLRTGDFNGEYSNKNLAFASLGDGLTDTEAANFYTAVQTFQTSLNRQV